MKVKNGSSTPVAEAHPARKWDEEGTDLIQHLIDAGFEIEAGSIRLSLQTRYTKSTVPVPPHEKKLVDDKIAALKRVETWLQKMIDELPIVATNAALLWLGYDHCRNNQEKPEWELPWWVLFHWDGQYQHQDPTPINEGNIRNRLKECLNDQPSKTIRAISLSSMMYELAFLRPSHYSSAERLESFFSRNLLGWKNIVKNNHALARVTAWANIVYLNSSIPKKEKTITLIINGLEFLFTSPKHEQNRFLSILESWVKIIDSDEKSLSGYKSHHTLAIAARKALNVPNIKGKTGIAEEIDRTTNFQHADLSERRRYYQKIRNTYTSRSTPQQPTKPIGVTFAEDEEEALWQIQESFKWYKQDTLEKCVEYAYALSKKGKKRVMLETAPFLARGKCEGTTIRLSTTALAKLHDLTRNLNKHQLMGGKNISRSAALGLAIKLYADHLSLGSDHRDANGYGDRADVLTEELPTNKGGRRKQRDPGQSHYVSLAHRAPAKPPEDGMEGAISTYLESLSASASPAQVSQPAPDEQPEAVPLNPASPSATNNVIAVSSQALVSDQGQPPPAQHHAAPPKEQDMYDVDHNQGATPNKPTPSSLSNRSSSQTKPMSVFELAIELREKRRKDQND